MLNRNTKIRPTIKNPADFSSDRTITAQWGENGLYLSISIKPSD